MTIPRHFKKETAFRTRPFGLLGALALASAAWLTTPTPAAATPITYTLSNMTGTWIGSQPPHTVYGTDTFTGSFVFDPANFLLPYTAVNITVSGPVGTAGIHTNASTSEFGNNIRITQGASLFPAFTIAFNNPLSTVPDGIFLFGIACAGCGLPTYDVNASSVTGEVVPSIPEPASLALLGGALGFFLFALELRRRGERA